jgi:hypothetical protein
LDDAWALLASGLDVIEGRLGRAIGTGARKILPQKDRLDLFEGRLGQQDLGYTVTPSQPVPISRILDDSVSIGSLNAVHPAGILRLAAAKEPGSRSATPFLEIGHLQGMEMAILGKGNARLPAKIEAS